RRGTRAVTRLQGRVSPACRRPRAPDGGRCRVTALDVDRVDGREKTVGTARYTADTQVEGVTYAVFATGTIARGRVVELDAAAAEAAPGVVAVFTHLNLPQARE